MTFLPIWEETAIVAARASTCAKSRRGAVLFWGGLYLGGATNGPPAPFRCLADDACRNACNQVAVHAEERLLIHNLGDGSSGPNHAQRLRIDEHLTSPDTRGTDLIHAKVDEAGELAWSGGPSCWQCSRMILDAGVARVWLYHGTTGYTAISHAGISGAPPGWQCYEATEFHRRTLEFCGLPIGAALG